MSTTTRQLYRETTSNGFSPAFIPPVQAQESHFINRDLSLIEFFRRVLDEGLDKTQPILERVKFLAIFSSNLDEFFQIRVSSLKEKLGQKVEVSPDGLTRPELLAEIRLRISELIERQMSCLRDDIIPELANSGIVLATHATLSAGERELVDSYFKEKVYPVLTPQAVDPTHPFPYISGGSINLAFFVKPELNKRVARALKNVGDEFFVRVKIPAFIPRFLPVGDSEEKYILIEDLVAANIRLFAPEADPASCHTFRITRDADIELRENEAADLLEMMELNLRQRRFGDVVRLEIAESMPAEMAGYLINALEIINEDVYSIDGPLCVTDGFAIASLNRPDLKERDLKITMPQAFETGESTFDIIRRSDVLLHHPYMAYSHITDFLREAAEDPDVLAIKMCLYRIGADSPIAPLLIEASQRGKQVTALIEIKARFDEANNIEWGKRLERAGVHVVYGLLGLKTHAKTTLIIRREGDELRRYVHLATGNYNPATSAVYTDFGLLTDDEKIGEDVTELFNYLTVYSRRENFNKLLIAPINLRERMIEMIERETENAESGIPARIIAKINRLADARMVQALYKASQAGVQIDLIVRGICTLRPGVPGLSENIRVRSIVGRLLEHSRVYYFENGGNGEVFMGSSDWMPRNLDRRVEVLAPIQDIKMKTFLRDEYLETYLKDNVKARELRPDGLYERVVKSDNAEEVNAQAAFQNSPGGI
ncbi:MAG: polyphosphate kinase 1 [Pyrinomonadaceae bacterium]